MQERRKELVEIAKKVAQVLAENRVTYSEVKRVFVEAMNFLTVCATEDRNS